ncbi:hypothetical protein L7F22_034967 [Adiantum nelumboides]|nr:hypothetical protein [Adiantum nelumboides]
MWKDGGDLESAPVLYPGIPSDENVYRWAFIRKVYCILLTQILLTAIVSAVIVFYDPVAVALTSSPAILIVLCILPFISPMASGEGQLSPSTSGDAGGNHNEDYGNEYGPPLPTQDELREMEHHRLVGEATNMMLNFAKDPKLAKYMTETVFQDVHAQWKATTTSPLKPDSKKQYSEKELEEEQKKAANRHRRDLKLKEDDWVLLRFEKARLRKKKGKERLFQKLSMRYYGAFQITERINGVSFRRLLDIWKINAFHVSLLKPFKGDVPNDGELDEQPEVEENEEILVPEQILAHKDTKTKVLCPLFYYHQQHPLNLLLLGLFTVCISLTVGIVCAYTEGKIILEALILTTATVLGLTLYTFWAAKRGYDFNFLGPMLSAALMVLILFGFIQLLFPLGPLSSTIYGAVASIIFCVYIVYDTDNLIKRYDYDQYIWASVALYLDVLNLFLALLNLLRGR